MKKQLLIIVILFVTVKTNAQHFQPDNEGISFIAGAGASGYWGDLTEKSKLLSQPGYSFTAGFSYRYNRYFDARAEFSILNLKASDSKNKRADLKNRNLNFKTNVWDFNLIVDYNLHFNTEERKLKPYVFFGVGLCRFNPYTTNRSGDKVYLQPLGTEGQGLSAYPDRKPYERTVIQLPMGLGVKYAVSNRIMLQLEYKYRYLPTDYLDDVSMAGYPSSTTLAAANPGLPLLTYRGDELPGGEPYPNNAGLNRGNPNNRDTYYTLQFKLAYRLSAKGIEILY